MDIMSTCFATILTLGIGQSNMAVDSRFDGGITGKFEFTQEVFCPRKDIIIQVTGEHASMVDTHLDGGINTITLEFKKVFK